MVLDFFAGCVGGSAGLIVGYPFDTIKVHIQTQSNLNPQYRGTWHCFQTILAKESFAGFYKGITSPLAGVAVINAIVFGVYGHAQKNYISNTDNLSTHFFAGAAAGLAQSPVASPLELAKTRLQLQQSKPTKIRRNPPLPTASNLPSVGNAVTKTYYSSPLQCLCEIYKTSGIRGVFRGLSVTALREVPGYGLYFWSYEGLIKYSIGDTKSLTTSTTFCMLIAGGLAGTISWIFTYPIDVIKSRLQADYSGRYSSALHCLGQSVQEEGLRCLYRGLNSTILRAFPTNAITFTVVHWTYKLCGGASETINEMKNKLEFGTNEFHSLKSSDRQINSILYTQINNNKNSDINYYHSDNYVKNNNNVVYHNHHQHHSNVLLDNFQKIFGSIIDNTNNFNFHNQATSGGTRHNKYESTE